VRAGWLRPVRGGRQGGRARGGGCAGGCSRRRPQAAAGADGRVQVCAQPDARRFAVDQVRRPPRLRSVQKAGDLHRTTSAASILPAQRALALHGVRTRQRLTRCRLRQGAGAQRDGRHARGWACYQAAAAPGGRCQGDRRAGGAGEHRGGAGAAAAEGGGRRAAVRTRARPACCAEAGLLR